MMNNETISMPAAGTEEITVQQTVPEAIATEAAQQPEEKAVVEHLERYPGVRRELTQAQLDAREERRLELERTFSNDDYRVARKEMHSTFRDPYVMIRGDSVTFNQAIIDSFEGISYINIYFSEKLGKMAIKPVSRNTSHAMHWCSESKDKRKPRRVFCPDMTKWFFDAMGWNDKTRYRVLGYLIDVDGEPVYVFDFHYPRMFDERRLNDEGNTLPVDRKGRYSNEARRSMTMPVDEFRRSIAEEEKNSFVNADILIGDDKLSEQTEETAKEAAEFATVPQNAETGILAAMQTDAAQEAPVAANTGDREGYGGEDASKPGMVVATATSSACVL